MFDDVKDALERIGLRLPFSSHFDTDLNASVDLLGSALIVDTELEDIAIVEVV